MSKYTAEKVLRIAYLLKEVIVETLSTMKHIGDVEQTMREVMQLAGQQSLTMLLNEMGQLDACAMLAFAR